MGGEPVGDHHAVKAPLVPQHLGKQPRMLGRVSAVELVVGGHDRPRAGPHGLLERPQVQLPQHGLVDLRADGVPLELRVVAGQVLDAAGDPGGLHPGDVRRRDLAGELGIFGEALEVPSAERVPVQVDGRPEQDVRPGPARLAAQFCRHLRDQAGIPGGRERRAAGEAGRAAGDEALPPGAAGAVGHHQGGDRGPLDGRQPPHIFPGEQGDLLLQGQAGFVQSDSRDEVTYRVLGKFVRLMSANGNMACQQALHIALVTKPDGQLRRRKSGVRGCQMTTDRW